MVKQVRLWPAGRAGPEIAIKIKFHRFRNQLIRPIHVHFATLLLTNRLESPWFSSVKHSRFITENFSLRVLREIQRDWWVNDKSGLISSNLNLLEGLRLPARTTDHDDRFSKRKSGKDFERRSQFQFLSRDDLQHQSVRHDLAERLPRSE